MIIDTHAHFDDEAFNQDRDALLKSMSMNEIGRIVNIGASFRGCEDTLLLTKEYDFIYGSLGIHPEDVENMTQQRLSWIKEHCKDEKIVAIGEIGLDYHYDTPTKDCQKEWFIKQLALARDMALPVVIHSRDAAKDTLDIMKEEHAEQIGGVIHCFSYGIEMAKEYLDMGFFLGIGGVLTFKNAKKLKEVVEYTPMDKIVLETDSPYLSPEPNRGKRNDSRNLTHVVNAISELKQLSVEEVITKTTENAYRLYPKMK